MKQRLVAIIFVLSVLVRATPVEAASIGNFINGIYNTYGIELIDEHGYLSGDDGGDMMNAIEFTLKQYTAAFIKEIVSFYKTKGSSMYISLENPDDELSGYFEWDGDATIALCYDADPEYNGISTETLAHELGHAVHYAIIDKIGEKKAERDLRDFNGGFAYAGSSAEETWREPKHGTTFAYWYGMYDAYEDFASIIETLIVVPGSMHERLSNPDNEPLRKKTEYVRDMIYTHISDKCSAVFAPLKATPPATTAPLTGILSPSKIFVDGTPVSAEGYLINGSNYLKLRDIAMFLNGSGGTFDLGYEPATKIVTLLPGRNYTPAGGELSAGGAAMVSATPTASPITMNGRILEIKAYLINGNNYIKLRDLCDAMNIEVQYNPVSKDISLYTSFALGLVS